MITAITIHAIDRLQERRQLQHFVQHCHKMQKWGLPDTGETVHNGYRYITRGGVLITVIPPSREYRKMNMQDELCHRIAKTMMICPSLWEEAK